MIEELPDTPGATTEAEPPASGRRSRRSGGGAARRAARTGGGVKSAKYITRALPEFEILTAEAM
nr:hypothetical protein [Paracoccaceae bacterium]